MTGLTLPNTWVTARLGEVAKVNPALDKNLPDDLEVSFVPMSAVEAGTGRIGVSATRRYGDVKKGYTQFAQNDVLFAKITPCMENGKMAVVPALVNGRGVGSTEFHVLKPQRGVIPKYLYHFIASEAFRREAERNMTGAVGQRRVPTSHLVESLIPFPPTSEQVRIVAKIEELLSEIDKGVESLVAARQRLTVYRQSVIKYAFEGRATSGWRETHKDDSEPASALLLRIAHERACRYEENLAAWKNAERKWKKDGEKGPKPPKPRSPAKVAAAARGEVPYALPACWRWTQVSEFADLVTDGTHHTPTYTDNGVPFISVKDVYDGAVHFERCKFISKEEHDVLTKRCKPEPGDLLVTKSGTIGRLAIVPETEFSLFVSVALIKIQSAKAYISPRWLRYAFEHHIMGLNIDQDIKGGLLKNYHLEDLRVARLPLCGFSEQEALADFVDQKLTLADSFAATIDDELKRAGSLRQSVFKRAFSGRLLTPDPNAEPASALLDRIRAAHGQNIASNNEKIKTQKGRRHDVCTDRI